MLGADFCLVPKGDTPTSSRFYSAVACGCVPLVVSDDMRHHLPFKARVNYSFIQHVHEKNFVADPTREVEAAMARLGPRLPALRRLMLDAAPELLYEVDGSRVAENMLLEYEQHCTTLGPTA